MHVDGACHCGFITFEADIDPESARVCHCTDCQVMSGTAFRTNVSTTVNSFGCCRGRPRTTPRLRTVVGGASWASALHAALRFTQSPIAQTRRAYNLRVGTLRQAAEIEPKVQIWWRSGLPWFKERLGALHHRDTDH